MLESPMATLTDQLASICLDGLLDQGKAVLREPYIPFIPAPWNRVLVLAEAQNLSPSDYVTGLEALSPDQRVRRLYQWSFVGVQPWDDGTLKVSVEAALGLQAMQSAVSNAVLWSIRGPRGNNATPTPDLERRSVVLWTEMLRLMNPTHVVAAGAVARGVARAALDAAHCPARLTAWALPSPRILTPLSRMVGDLGLLERFPEVAEVGRVHPDWLAGPRRANKVLYACLATALGDGDDGAIKGDRLM